MFTPQSSRRVHLLRRLRRLKRFSGTYIARQERLVRRSREPGISFDAWRSLDRLYIEARRNQCELEGHILHLQDELDE